jgi:hypothetical protein
MPGIIALTPRAFSRLFAQIAQFIATLEVSMWFKVFIAHSLRFATFLRV